MATIHAKQCVSFYSLFDSSQVLMASQTKLHIKFTGEKTITNETYYKYFLCMKKL